MRAFFFNFSNALLGEVKYNQYICALQNQKHLATNSRMWIGFCIN